MMAPYPWQALLSRWSKDIIEAEEYRSALPPEVIAAGWLGYPGATDAQIRAAEARLGTTLPPSYRAFLQVTNGWRMTTASIDTLRSTAAIAWYANDDPETIAIWMEGEELGVSDTEYLVYGERVDQPLRAAYLQTALAISDYGDGIYLLNPQIVTPDGEWEAWFFASWLPGARRYPSFWELMQREHDHFLQQLQSRRGEPTPFASPALGVAADDIDGLLGALARPDHRQRIAALQALGNLRHPRAFDVVLAIFQNPDEDLFVREAAARTLGRLRDPRAAPSLIESFRSRPSPASTPRLAGLLGGLGTLSGALLGTLSLDDLLGHMEALWGKPLADHLRATLTPKAVSQGIAAHLNHAVRQGLLELGAAARPALVAAVHDPDPSVRAGAVSTLCHAPEKPGVFEQVSAAVADADPTVRATIAAHLAQFGDPRAIAIVLDLVADPDASVRANAATSLGAMYLYAPDERVPPTLLQLQHDPASDVREAAQRALRNVPGVGR